MSLQNNLLRGMIRANLEQAEEMLDAGHPKVAIGHLREAITQIELSADIGALDSDPAPQIEQTILDV